MSRQSSRYATERHKLSTMTLVQIFISLPLSYSSLGLQKLFCRARLKSAMYNRFFLPRGLTKRFSKGLCFIDLGGVFYKTKTPLISRLLVSDKAFKWGSSFCRFRGAFLQNEDPLEFTSIGVWQSVFVTKLAIHHDRSCFMTQSGLFFDWYTDTFELF